MPMPAATPTPRPTPAPEPGEKPSSAPVQPPGHEPGMHHEMPAMGMPGETAESHGHEAMSGLLGEYPMSREASGTAWQPEAAPHEGVHLMRGAWHAMAHANVFVQYTEQGSDRGESALDSVNMGMLIAQRPLGGGRLGLKGMISLEPATVGSRGYPLLLQTGETADGETPLVDRQHPHDFLMELAATWSRPVVDRGSPFVYVGWPGEPALGPAAYMHRFSGIENPETPLAHHWLDSTHIAWGVVTAGWAAPTWKVEVSAFRGREPDEHRWDFESAKLDSGSARVTWNPSERWSVQASYGELHSPEQLEPEVDVERTTASASYVAPMADGRWGATLAWGRNARDPGVTTDALLLEGTWAVGPHTVFARAEWLENDELAPALGVVLEEPVELGEINFGYERDFWHPRSWAIGAGASGRVSFVPRPLEGSYGERRPVSGLVMLRAAVR
jgi:hypothetical protein